MYVSKLLAAEMAAFWSCVNEFEEEACVDAGAGAGEDAGEAACEAPVAGVGAGEAAGAEDGVGLATVPEGVPVAPLLWSVCPTASDDVDM